MDTSTGGGLATRTNTLFAGALFILLLLAASLSGNAAAQSSATGATLPVLTGHVVDSANILQPADESRLDALLAAHEDATSNQIVVVTVIDLQGDDIASYANRLGRHWQIGTAEQNNGVLLVIAPNERKVRIEVGYGLEGALPDALSGQIIRQEILPAFRDEAFVDGIDAGIKNIIGAIAGEYKLDLTAKRRTKDGTEKFKILFPLVFMAIVAIQEILNRFGKHKIAKSAFPGGFAGLFSTIISGQLWIGIAIALGVFLLVYFTADNSSWPGSSGSSRTRRHGGVTGGLGGSSSGGGFSGGGGSFGGGGASGSW